VRLLPRRAATARRCPTVAAGPPSALLGHLLLGALASLARMDGCCCSREARHGQSDATTTAMECVNSSKPEEKKYSSERRKTSLDAGAAETHREIRAREVPRQRRRRRRLQGPALRVPFSWGRWAYVYRELGLPFLGRLGLSANMSMRASLTAALAKPGDKTTLRG
jgi:hypothetical protein